MVKLSRTQRRTLTRQARAGVLRALHDCGALHGRQYDALWAQTGEV